MKESRSLSLLEYAWGPSALKGKHLQANNWHTQVMIYEPGQLKQIAMRKKHNIYRAWWSFVCCLKKNYSLTAYHKSFSFFVCLVSFCRWTIQAQWKHWPSRGDVQSWPPTRCSPHTSRVFDLPSLACWGHTGQLYMLQLSLSLSLHHFSSIISLSCLKFVSSCQ